MTTRLTRLLAAAVLGVYALTLTGAATAVADAATGCALWPACGGTLVLPTDPALLAALAHRLTALGVGVVLLVTAIEALATRIEHRVRLALGAAVAAYPIQLWLGTLTALDRAPLGRSSLHLVLGAGIFTGLVAALTWHLDASVPDDAPTGSEPAGTPDGGPSASEGPDPPGTTGQTPRTTGATGGIRARAAAYLRMTKPRLMWLLCLVALAGIGLAGGRTVAPSTVGGTLLGGVLAIGASGTFNNVLERDRDRQMARTADRPLVTDQVPVHRAAAFGFVLAGLSITVFLAFTNVLAAALGVVAILFYSVVYTLLLKPNTDQNTVIGGFAGALPALIGWAAVTNSIALPAVVLAGVIFLWTPAHFYNLALAHREDYARAGFPMLPVSRGTATTYRHILGYLGATLLAAVLLGTTPALGGLYVLATVLGGGVFLWAVVRLTRTRSTDAAFRAFHASNAFLGLVLVAVVGDTMLL